MCYSFTNLGDSFWPPPTLFHFSALNVLSLGHVMFPLDGIYSVFLKVTFSCLDCWISSWIVVSFNNFFFFV